MDSPKTGFLAAAAAVSSATVVTDSVSLLADKSRRIRILEFLIFVRFWHAWSSDGTSLKNSWDPGPVVKFQLEGTASRIDTECSKGVRRLISSKRRRGDTIRASRASRRASAASRQCTLRPRKSGLGNHAISPLIFLEAKMSGNCSAPVHHDIHSFW